MASLEGRILAELHLSATALDDELGARLGVVRQTVNQVCRRLAAQGRIERGAPGGGKIVNWTSGASSFALPAGPADLAPSAIRSGSAFEQHAGAVLSAAWGVSLRSRIITLPGGVTHSFDLVSEDEAIVGDAKWFKDLRPMPSAKLSVIAEYVWLLQHVERSRRRFLVFGQDRAVPQRWLRRFGSLVDGVEFWFLDEDLSRFA